MQQTATRHKKKIRNETNFPLHPNLHKSSKKAPDSPQTIDNPQ